MPGATVTISLAGEIVEGGTGLARHPQTDVLYALLKLQGSSFRRLVTLDEVTGVATLVGDTGRRFASMTFTADGTLFAVTGDGSGLPETLFTVSTLDASSTQVASLGAGSDGEAIGFNSDDGLIYHASGIGTPNNPNGEKFETVDPISFVTTNIPLSGFDYEELTTLHYSDGAFFAGDIGNSSVDMPRFYRITTGGVVTFLGAMDHVSKGLAPVASTQVPALSNPMLALLVVALALTSRAVRSRRGGRLRFSQDATRSIVPRR